MGEGHMESGLAEEPAFYLGLIFGRPVEHEFEAEHQRENERREPRRAKQQQFADPTRVHHYIRTTSY